LLDSLHTFYIEKKGNAPMEKQKCVLIVDDEESVLDILSKFLTDEGYTVITAGHAALGAARAQYVDCIILDLQLSPQRALEGGSILSHIWKDTWCNVPIIVFSGLVGTQEVDETLQQIENAYGKGRNIFRLIPKSKGVRSLIDAVNECMGLPGPNAPQYP
jgi:CheY-like chemotaxis protein